jgi:hypothetical protein
VDLFFRAIPPTRFLKDSLDSRVLTFFVNRGTFVRHRAWSQEQERGGWRLGFRISQESLLFWPLPPTSWMEPLVGFEPTTYSLRMNCSTPELQRLFTLATVKTTEQSAARKLEIPARPRLFSFFTA